MKPPINMMEFASDARKGESNTGEDLRLRAVEKLGSCLNFMKYFGHYRYLLKYPGINRRCIYYM